MSASREKKTRSDATYVQRRNHREEDKDRRKHVLYGIAGGVVVVLAIALLVWDSGFFQKRSTAVTIDGENYGPAVVQYYYQTALNTAYYNSMMGASTFDYSVDPAEQVYDEESGQTWRDYLLDQAIDDLTQVTALVHTAESEGYTLPQKDQAYLESQLNSLDSVWRSNSSYDSLSSYLKLNYGSYMDEDTFRQIYADQVLADSYRQHYQDSLTYTDEEVETYYSEHANDLDTFGYTVFTVQATVEEQTDEEGNTVEMTDEEKTAALETAKADALATAQAIQSRLTNGEDAQALADEYADQLYSSVISRQTVGSSLLSAYSEWAMDQSRQPGDVTLAESDYTNSYNYYVVLFEGRQLDETPTANVRHILVAAEQDEGADEPTQEQYDAAYTQAEELLAQWKDGEATEESFTQLAVEHSADSAVSSNEGLYSVSSTSGYDANFMDWALDPSRQPGDTGIVQNTTSSVKGWHIMYYVSSDDPIWRQTVTAAFREDDYDALDAQAIKSYSYTTGIGLNFVTE